MSFYFLKTCEACPEQYDVYNESGNQVGYIRLRYGLLTLEYPANGCVTIYEYKFEDGMKGGFDNQEERDKYLQIMFNVLLETLEITTECDYVIVDNPNWLLDKLYGKQEI